MKKNCKFLKDLNHTRLLRENLQHHIGPYFLKRKFPNTIFGTYIENYQSNLNEVAHGGF